MKCRVHLWKLAMSVIAAIAAALTGCSSSEPEWSPGTSNGVYAELDGCTCMLNDAIEDRQTWNFLITCEAPEYPSDDKLPVFEIPHPDASQANQRVRIDGRTLFDKDGSLTTSWVGVEMELASWVAFRADRETVNSYRRGLIVHRIVGDPTQKCADDHNQCSQIRDMRLLCTSVRGGARDIEGIE